MTKILVIDTEKEARNMFLKCLEKEGFDVIVAENGLVGVERAQEYLPDLIISDILMPKLNGYGVLRALRQNPITAIILFIFVTTKVTQADIRKGMELGADDYLTKPCSPKELLKAIISRLDRQASLQKWYAAQFQPLLKSPEIEITKPTTPQLIFPSDPQLKKIFYFIEANYYQQITLNDIALAVGYSPSYLSKLVRHKTGQTIQSWIIQRRMAAARSLLVETSEKVEQIATLVGYQHPVHFFRQFRQYHGATPLAWRKAKAHCSFIKYDIHQN
ncbi:MAG: DNA-binding response regulator [Nostoc sp. CmiVER01]|uniref:response regulator transcription factor n=1 Tax=Nostoc sp. CmiVER01 TaxID=3075384 RepID=UPI002AD29B19|nr:DNA-binding response regulator [Nostoc sp. CmiVER01]MDZ8123584.1 DNA-binding response regulator [Nostoc sp. CmiVER01]